MKYQKKIKQSRFYRYYIAVHQYLMPTASLLVRGTLSSIDSSLAGLLTRRRAVKSSRRFDPPVWHAEASLFVFSSPGAHRVALTSLALDTGCTR